MDRIKEELDNADEKIKDAIQSIDKARSNINDKYYSVTNIYTEGGGVTIDKLGQAIDNKMEEVKVLNNVINSQKKIIELKDAHIKLLLETLADNKKYIDRMIEEMKELKKGIKNM